MITEDEFSKIKKIVIQRKDADLIKKCINTTYNNVHKLKRLLWKQRIDFYELKLDEFISHLDIDIEDLYKFGSEKDKRRYERINLAIKICKSKYDNLIKEFIK